MTIKIVPIAGTDMRLVAGEWHMPEQLRAEVPASWARRRAKTPQVWGGRILGFSDVAIGPDGVLRAEAREDAYSVFLAWHEAGFPEIGLTHIFGAAWICSSDGALILGVMGRDTVNAGRVYAPGGSLEPRDVRADGRVDAEGCIAAELMEETGLAVDDGRKGPLLAIFHGPRLCISRVIHFDATADELLATIRGNLARQEHRELADVVACRNADDGRKAGDLADYAAAVLDAVSTGKLELKAIRRRNIC